MLAIRLLATGAIIFLGPGLALARRWRLALEWPERLTLAFALSYGWIFLLSVVLPLAKFSVDVAAGLSIALIVVSLWSGGIPDLSRCPRFRLPAADVLLIAALVAIAASTWRIESPLSGEEALDLVSSARFADGGPITFTDMSIMPDTKSVYLFQPYQLSIGLIARWGHTDPLVTLIKLRPLFVFLALVIVYALVRQLTPQREQALAAMGVVLVFVSLDATTWELASLIPYARRGGFTEGLCIPALLTLVLIATTRAEDEARRWMRAVVGLAACLLLLGAMATHPLEVVPALFFVAAIVAMVLLRADATRDTRRTLTLSALLILAVGVYMQVQRYAVPEVSGFEDASKQAPRAELARLARTPAKLIAGPMDRTGRNVLANDLPNSTAGTLAVPALLVGAIVVPNAALLLFLALVPLLLLHASPGGFLALGILTSPSTVGHWSGYPETIGLLAVAIGFVSVGQCAATAASSVRPGMSRVATIVTIASVLSPFWLWGPEAAGWYLKFAAAEPRLFILSAAALGIPIMVFVRHFPIEASRPRGSRVRLCAALTIAALGVTTFIVFRTTEQSPVIVSVHWDDSIDRSIRASLEKRLSLIDGEDTSDPAVRTYTLADTTAANVRAIVQEPAVKDTQHINRKTYDVDRPSRRYKVSKAVWRLGGVTAAIWAIGVLLPFGWSSRQRAMPFPGVVALMATFMAVPLAGLGRPEPERLTLVARMRAAQTQPSVLDWTRYYEVARATMNNQTPIRVPRTVVDALKARLPARRTLLSNPDYSCALAALLNAYCVNPKETYGHYFLSANSYLTQYRQIHQERDPWHPFFNSTWPIDERERSFLKTYRVEYLLADPEHAELIQRKLDSLPMDTTVDFRIDGYVLHRFN